MSESLVDEARLYLYIDDMYDISFRQDNSRRKYMRANDRNGVAQTLR